LNNALLPPLFHAPALKPLVESVDFDEWQAVVGSSLGEHRSTLRTPGKEHAATNLLDALREWEQRSAPWRGDKRERITTVRRRTYVADARQWMRHHLHEPCGVLQVAAAVEVSPRTLQYAFLQEHGHTPMAELRRLRLRHLQQLLQDPDHRTVSIAELMAQTGLLASGSTAADYRRYCGESPRETRQQTGPGYQNR